MKIMIDNKMVKNGGTTIYLENISIKYLKTEEKPTPKYLMKIMFFMILIPIIFSCINKSFWVIEAILIIAFIIGIRIHQKDLYTHLLILCLNNSKEHVIIAKEKSILKFIDEFIDLNLTEKLLIDIETGDYIIFSQKGNKRPGNVVNENT